jgi:hypothetical protein
MTLDADDKAWIVQTLKEMLTPGQQAQVVLPGSFLDRLNTARSGIEKKKARGAK